MEISVWISFLCIFAIPIDQKKLYIFFNPVVFWLEQAQRPWQNFLFGNTD